METRTQGCGVRALFTVTGSSVCSEYAKEEEDIELVKLPIIHTNNVLLATELSLCANIFDRTLLNVFSNPFTMFILKLFKQTRV